MQANNTVLTSKYVIKVEIQPIDGNRLITKGLEMMCGHEFLLKQSSDTQGDYNLLNFIVNYLDTEKQTIKHEETMAYGLWPLKFLLENDALSIYEFDETFVEWRLGAQNAVYYLEQQREICIAHDVQSLVPSLNQMIAVSNGVLNGMDVQGVRYYAPSHMSGWYITASDYNGDIRTLNVISLFSLISQRLDLIPFLALPPGMRFKIKDDTYEAWWDKVVFDASPE